MKRALLAAVALFAPLSAFAQGAVVQNGPVTGFHAGAWFQSGVQGDGGTTKGPFLDALGLFSGASCPFGVSSQPNPGLSADPYAIFTFCQTAAASTFTFMGVNGNPTPDVIFNIGGVLYPFLLPISTVAQLPVCNGNLEGVRRGVTDAADPSYLSPVYGGGTVHLGVGCDGTSWVAGY